MSAFKDEKYGSHYKCPRCDGKINMDKMATCKNCGLGWWPMYLDGWHDAIEKYRIRWTRFNGEYEKIHHDIQLLDGQVHRMCWPNAGMFHTRKGEEIPGELVKYIRISKNHPLDDLEVNL